MGSGVGERCKWRGKMSMRGETCGGETCGGEGMDIEGLWRGLLLVGVVGADISGTFEVHSPPLSPPRRRRIRLVRLSTAVRVFVRSNDGNAAG